MYKHLLYKRLYEAIGISSIAGHVRLNKLAEICKNHPYFFAGNFLLLVESDQSGDISRQLQHNALHVNNIMWLKRLLADIKNETKPNPFAKEIATIAFVEDEVQEHIEAVMQEQEGAALGILEEEYEAVDDESSFTQLQDPDSDKLASVLKEQLIVFEKAVEADAIIPIETAPFYRVDYFAYQGIKLEGQKNDALSAKTRRFTDWLRHFRSSNPNPTDLGTDLASENKIVTLAGQSIENPEIITEAMAQVLERQGKTAKAIRLYEKLSFLNPSKSAFFAAKIEELSK